MPATVEAQEAGKFLVPAFSRGKYAQFAGTPKPTELAGGMGIAYDTRESRQVQAVLHLLDWLYTSPRLGLTYRFLAYLERLAAQLRLQENQTKAAEASAQVFGEVTGGDEALPLWVVWHALHHNTAEARSRLISNAELLADLLTEVKIMIELRIQAAEAELRNLETSIKSKAEASQKVKLNQSRSYHAVYSQGEKTVSAFQTVIFENGKSATVLKQEIKELKILRQLMAQGHAGMSEISLSH